MMARIKNLLTLLVSSILFSVLLTACSLNFLGLGGSSATPTPKSTPTSTSSLLTYKGDGFSISYPQDWKVQKSNNQVQFVDSTGVLNFIVEVVPDPNGIVPTDTFVKGILQGFKKNSKNYKDENISPTSTINGITWDQGSASADVTASGQTANSKTIVMATTHPEHDPTSRIFSLIYGAPSVAFDLSNTAYFQPMAQSFKFSS